MSHSCPVGLPDRSRPPRLFGLDGSLQIVEHREAGFNGDTLLGRVTGRWGVSGERYVIHFEAESGQWCIITTKTMLIVRGDSLALEWEIPLDDIDEVMIHMGSELHVLDREHAREYALSHIDIHDNGVEYSKKFICEHLGILQSIQAMLEYHICARLTHS